LEGVRVPGGGGEFGTSIFPLSREAGPREWEAPAKGGGPQRQGADLKRPWREWHRGIWGGKRGTILGKNAKRGIKW